MKKIFSFLLLISLIVSACKKDNIDSNSVILTKRMTEDFKSSIEDYLFKKSQTVPDSRRFSPKKLLKKINFSTLKVIKTTDGYIILSKFKKEDQNKSSIYSNRIESNYQDSVLIFHYGINSVDNFYIVKYTGDSITENNVENFYSLKNISETGTYKYYNDDSRFMSEIKFNKGVFQGISVLLRKASLLLSNQRTESGCTDWYIITTFYNSNGSITGQYETYIGTTCDGSCAPSDTTLESLECSGGTAGDVNQTGNNMPGDKLCSGSLTFKAGAQNSFWETNVTGLRFENGQTVNEFNAYFNLVNGISDAAMHNIFTNSATGISAYTALQQIPALQGLLSNGDVYSQTTNGQLFWYFNHHAAQVISGWAANFAALTVSLEIPDPANPLNSIARNEWKNRTDALVRSIIPGSKVNFTQYGQSSQYSIAAYGTNCN
jgi:hypothetical protein